MFQEISEIDIDELKKEHERLYYFGLGFIQLKLNDHWRLHFYARELPPITEDIHNHRYNFTSRILAGSITNFTYTVDTVVDEANATHVMVNESCNPEVKAPAESTLCKVEIEKASTYFTDQSYRMDYRIFHRVEATDCITALSRTPYRQNFAQVVTPIGSPSICPFSKTVPEAHLWEIIEAMLERHR